jgi:hypothetical protein
MLVIRCQAAGNRKIFSCSWLGRDATRPDFGQHLHLTPVNSPYSRYVSRLFGATYIRLLLKLRIRDSRELETESSGLLLYVPGTGSIILSINMCYCYAHSRGFDSYSFYRKKLRFFYFLQRIVSCERIPVHGAGTHFLVRVRSVLSDSTTVVLQRLIFHVCDTQTF